MKRNKFFGGMFILLLLATASLVSATITDYNCDDDGDGAIVMYAVNLTGSEGEYTLAMDCNQYWDPGHILGDFTTNTELDPNVRLLEDVENDTTFAWTDYHIAIGMTKPFSILSTGLAMPSGWTFIITAPASGQLLPGGGTGWLGMVNYYQGTGSPIAIGDVGTFGFKVSFLGSVAFCTEQVPTPEPATIALLGLGTLSLLRRKRGV